jgi:hypothetical protein
MAEIQKSKETDLGKAPKENIPTVADLEAKVKAGEPISLTELATAAAAEKGAKPEKAAAKKPSIIDQLKKDKGREAASKKDKPKSKSSEREAR